MGARNVEPVNGGGVTSLNVNDANAASSITIPAGDPMTMFTQGDIYFLTSSAGAAFCTITNIALLPQTATGGGQAYPVIVSLSGVPPGVHAGMSVRITLPD